MYNKKLLLLSGVFIGIANFVLCFIYTSGIWGIESIIEEVREWLHGFQTGNTMLIFMITAAVSIITLILNWENRYLYKPLILLSGSMDIITIAFCVLFHFA